MTLYSTVGDKLQNDVGKAEYWRNYEKFEGSEMHALIVQKLSERLNGSDTLNSRFDGKKILEQISQENPDIYKRQNEDMLGSLFGMTMWNYIANAESSWYFHREHTSHEDEKGSTVYFRRK